MSDIRITGEFEALCDGSSTVPFEIEFTNPKHHGLDAKFRIRHIVNVRDRDPVNIDTVVHERRFKIAGPKHNINVPVNRFPEFGHSGAKIEIACQAEVVVDDAIFFDSKERTDIALKRLKLNKDGLASNPTEVLAPHDDLNFVRNFLVLPFNEKVTWIAAFVAMICVAIGNFLFALFDAFFASQSLIYSSQNEVGLAVAGAGAFAGGYGFSKVHKTILRSYKVANLAPNLPKITKGTTYRISDFLTAKSSAHLYGVTLRLVVANLECGQYWRGSGTDRRRVTFSHPIRALVLYEETTAVIPKGVGIETYFNDRLDLDKVFECISPRNMISETHGLQVKTVIQIMVRDLADTYLELPWHVWNREDFADNHDRGDGS